MNKSREVIPQEFLWCIPKVYRSSSDMLLTKDFTVYYAFWRLLFNGIV